MHRVCRRCIGGMGLDLVCQLAVLGGIEAQDFVLFGHTQPDRKVDELEDNGGQDTGVGRRRDNRDRLDEQLLRVAVEQAIRTGGVDRLLREDAGCERTPDAADAVYREDIERVVHILLQQFDPEEADDTRDEPERDGYHPR